jgi:D-sedoheptulose 7-phosphate isomerase
VTESQATAPSAGLPSAEALAHVGTYFSEVQAIAAAIPVDDVQALVVQLIHLRERGGRLFLLGVGGSAANCSHAVNDFRKLCGIEAYAPTDNVSELTARTNDEGWDTVFSEWLKTSRAGSNDAVFVMSVGGGNLERNVSPNLVSAVREAKARRLTVLGIVGRNGGYTKEVGDSVVVVPTVAESRVTPHAEAFQAVIWHCLVSHPSLQVNATKW